MDVEAIEERWRRGGKTCHGHPMAEMISLCGKEILRDVDVDFDEPGFECV